METLKLTILAGQATPVPPLGPALGQKGIQAPDFCKQFNDLTKNYHSGLPINVKVFVKNKKFVIKLGFVNTTFLLKKLASLKKCNATNLAPLPSINIRHVYHIAEIKQKNSHKNNQDLKSLCKMVLGTAKSMHLFVSF